MGALAGDGLFSKVQGGCGARLTSTERELAGAFPPTADGRRAVEDTGIPHL